MNIIFEKTSGLRSGGTGHEDRSHAPTNTQRELINSSDREFGAYCVVAACFASPFVIAGLCLFAIKFCGGE